jgi:hypothetical protein
MVPGGIDQRGLGELMADGIVQIAPDSTGKKVDVSELAVGGNTIERQRINISSPTDPNAHADVSNEPPANPDNVYALMVRQIQEDNAYTQEILIQISNVLSLITQQKVVGVNAAQIVNLTAANLLATVSQATAANLNATVSQATAANLNATVNMANIAGVAPIMSTTNSPYGSSSLAMTLSQSFPMPGVPQHIYGGISV